MSILAVHPTKENYLLISRSVSVTLLTSVDGGKYTRHSLPTDKDVSLRQPMSLKDPTYNSLWHNSTVFLPTNGLIVLLYFESSSMSFKYQENFPLSTCDDPLLLRHFGDGRVVWIMCSPIGGNETVVVHKLIRDNKADSWEATNPYLIEPEGTVVPGVAALMNYNGYYAIYATPTHLVFFDLKDEVATSSERLDGCERVLRLTVLESVEKLLVECGHLRESDEVVTTLPYNLKTAKFESKIFNQERHLGKLFFSEDFSLIGSISREKIVVQQFNGLHFIQPIMPTASLSFKDAFIVTRNTTDTLVYAEEQGSVYTLDINRALLGEDVEKVKVSGSSKVCGSECSGFVHQGDGTFQIALKEPDGIGFFNIDSPQRSHFEEGISAARILRSLTEKGGQYGDPNGEGLEAEAGEINVGAIVGGSFGGLVVFLIVVFLIIPVVYGVYKNLSR